MRTPCAARPPGRPRTLAASYHQHARTPYAARAHAVCRPSAPFARIRVRAVIGLKFYSVTQLAGVVVTSPSLSFSIIKP